jgi:hypothetical protein
MVVRYAQAGDLIGRLRTENVIPSAAVVNVLRNRPRRWPCRRSAQGIVSGCSRFVRHDGGEGSDVIRPANGITVLEIPCSR